jgi:protein tyrosine phosphatase (PTP) superfamily phosphohydrolase (DUF442 family)
MRLIPGCLVPLIVLASCLADSELRSPAPIPSSTIENLHRISPDLFVGGEPEGAPAFQQLAQLGVRTIISVDGAKPDVEAARKFGLRYVHLPIGYDGVPAERAAELGKALLELPGPVYVHCHHGKHRAPAAAAVGCVAAGRMNNEEALRMMKVMGTGDQYVGLWASARSAGRAGSTTLLELKVDFKESVQIPPLADAMVALDKAFEHLVACRKAGWRPPSYHPDLDPAHEALRAREFLAEILRTEDLSGRPANYKDWMRTAERSAQELESALREGLSTPVPGDRLEKAFNSLQQSCADCHRLYRNRPLK